MSIFKVVLLFVAFIVFDIIAILLGIAIDDAIGLVFAL